MGAITGTKLLNSECGGDYKIAIIQCTPAATSDTIELVPATHGIKYARALLGATLMGGLDANLASVHVSLSSYTEGTPTTLTVVTLNAAGGAATNWTGAVVNIAVLGN